MSEHGEEQRIAEMLARRVDQGADIQKVAVIAVAIWEEVNAALSPILNKSGVAALYKRSLYTTLADHRSLVPAYESIALSGSGLVGLYAAILQQTPEQALADLLALLINFHRLLASLIGGSLMERLLRPVWDQPSSGDVTKESE